MPSSAKAGTVIYAKDLDHVSNFYAAVTGFTVTERSGGYVVLESGDVQLVIVAMAPHLAHQIQIANPPLRRKDVAIKPVFVVPNLSACRFTATSLGGQLNDPDHEWEFQGAPVCDGHDPEGNVFQLRQGR